LRVFKNRVLMGMFEPKREEVMGGWRRLHDEELHNLYASPNVTRVMRSTEHVARMGELRSTYKILVGNLEGNSASETSTQVGG
jgi:hypothetical protein